jgi:hypothetical protein
MQSTLFSAMKTYLARAALTLKRYKDAIAVTLSVAAFVTSGINYYVSHIWHAHDLRAALIIGPLSAEEKEIPLLLVNAGKSIEILVGARFALEGDKPVREMLSIGDPFSPVAIKPGEVRQLAVANNQDALKGSANAVLNPIIQRAERASSWNAHLEITYIDKDHNLATARLKVGEMIIDERNRKAAGVVFDRAQALDTIIGK